MTGMMYEVGAVIQFVPERFEVVTHQGDDVGRSTEKCIGWATVVTHRDAWVVETEIQPMIVCCGSAQTFDHLQSAHRSNNEKMWKWELP